MDPDVVTILGVVLAAVIVAVVVGVLIARAARLPPGAIRDPAVCWQQAGPTLKALGLRQLDAECYTIELGSIRQTLYVKLEPASRSLFAWLERTCPGGALEAFLGQRATVSPGGGGSGLAGLIGGAVREVLGALPRGARLTVKAPEIPGDEYKADITSPFFFPQHAALVVRALLAVDEAARKPAPEGMRAQLPPVVHAWQQAAPALLALGMGKLDAETYTIGAIGQTLFLKLEVSEGRVRAWIDKPCPGGAIERFIGVSAELSPGDGGRSDLARFASSAVREILGSLPRGATLSIKGPEIPGDGYKADLSTPLTSPEHAVLAVRVLLALDSAAATAGGGHPAPLPPIAMRWREASAAIQALGMHPTSAEGYALDLGGPLHTMYLNLEVGPGALRGWLRGAAPGCVIERWIGQTGEVRPGGGGRSELESYLFGAVGQWLAGLPREARLSIKAPEIRGAGYEVNLTTPFTAPQQAAIVGQVLLAVDAALRRG